jgi:hypothetical protein
MSMNRKERRLALPDLRLHRDQRLRRHTDPGGSLRQLQLGGFEPHPLCTNPVCLEKARATTPELVS